MRIAVLGGYGVGLSFQLSRFPDPGETVAATQFAPGPGGKGSNQAIAAARLGADVRLISAVGSDPYAADALTLWASEGVDSSAVAQVPGTTMVGVILVEPNGENRIVIAPGALDSLVPAHIDAIRESIAEADILVVSLEVPVSVAVRALEIARESQTTTLVNPAPWSPLPAEAWDLIDILTPNQSEARAITGGILDPQATVDSSIELIREFFHGALLVTLGSDGVLVDAGGRSNLISAPHTEVVDTTGAGDAFTAALAVGLVSGANLLEAAEWATFAGAHSVRHEGVISSLPSRADLPPLTVPFVSSAAR